MPRIIQGVDNKQALEKPIARHYNTKIFFRPTPNALLKRYFSDQGLFGDLDFTTIKETKADALFEVWLERPDDGRKLTNADFKGIFELSCERSFKTIIDEAC